MVETFLFLRCFRWGFKAGHHFVARAKRVTSIHWPSCTMGIWREHTVCWYERLKVGRHTSPIRIPFVPCLWYDADHHEEGGREVWICRSDTHEAVLMEKNDGVSLVYDANTLLTTLRIMHQVQMLALTLPTQQRSSWVMLSIPWWRIAQGAIDVSERYMRCCRWTRIGVLTYVVRVDYYRQTCGG